MNYESVEVSIFDEQESGDDLFNTISVSYTHLDVYKRQVKDIA